MSKEFVITIQATVNFSDFTEEEYEHYRDNLDDAWKLMVEESDDVQIEVKVRDTEKEMLDYHNS